MTTAVLSAYFGWFRPSKSHPWQALAEGETYDEALRNLLARLPKEGRGGDSVVMDSDRDPNHEGDCC